MVYLLFFAKVSRDIQPKYLKKKSLPGKSTKRAKLEDNRGSASSTSRETQFPTVRRKARNAFERVILDQGAIGKPLSPSGVSLSLIEHDSKLSNGVLPSSLHSCLIDI